MSAFVGQRPEDFIHAFHWTLILHTERTTLVLCAVGSANPYFKNLFIMH